MPHPEVTKFIYEPSEALGKQTVKANIARLAAIAQAEILKHRINAERENLSQFMGKTLSLRTFNIFCPVDGTAPRLQAGNYEPLGLYSDDVIAVRGQLANVELVDASVLLDVAANDQYFESGDLLVPAFVFEDASVTTETSWTYNHVYVPLRDIVGGEITGENLAS